MTATWWQWFTFAYLTDWTVVWLLGRCERYADPELMDTWTGRPIEVLPVATEVCGAECRLQHAHLVGDR
jgi:hypothetical protein